MNARDQPGQEPGSEPGREPGQKPGPAVAGTNTDILRFALGSVLAVGAALAITLVAFSARYGYHRDELYFIACGRRLAWGYPDQPPLVPLLARLMTGIAPNSVVVLRLPSALASAVLVLLAGLIAREFGAERRAQVLAAAVAAAAPLVIGAGHLLSTTTFDLPAWALVSLLVMRILRTGDQRLWVVVGLVAGLGLFDSDLVAFLLFAIVAGLALAGPRRPFGSPWLYAGGAIALVLWLPYLAWQARHGWPELAISRSIASGGSGTSAPRWEIVPVQIALLGIALSPIWITGLVRLFRDAGLRWGRALGVAYVVLAVAFIVTGGKPYYLAGMFPVLLGAGVQPAVGWLRRGRRKARAGLLAVAFAATLTALPVTLPIVPAADLHDTPIVAANYDAGETLAWPVFVRQVAAVYRSLPAAQRRAAIVLGSNYGESGAIDQFGAADGLPRAYGVHNAYWYWGPPPPSATVVVAIGFDRTRLAPVCGRLRLAARLNNHLGVNDDEQGAPVWVCARRAPWSATWLGLRDLG